MSDQDPYVIDLSAAKLSTRLDIQTDDMLARGAVAREAVAAQDLLQEHGRGAILAELHRRGLDPQTGAKLPRAERRRVDRDIAKLLKKRSKQDRHAK